MSANPCKFSITSDRDSRWRTLLGLVIGVSLVGSIGTMWGAMSVSPERPLLKHALWLVRKPQLLGLFSPSNLMYQGFNGFQAATLSPFFFLSPALLGRAALYTCGVVGSLSYVGATAKNDTYLYMGGPLLAGVTVVALSSLAPLALPLGVRGLAISEAVSLYGGLAVFSGYVLYECVQFLLHRGNEANPSLCSPVHKRSCTTLVWPRRVPFRGILSGNPSDSNLMRSTSCMS